METRVADWMDQHTWRKGDWQAAQLARRKGDERISVVLPAKDEAATVGTIVARLRRELVERVPLVDELVVIDSRSADHTAAVAAAAGARVVRQADIAPEVGDRPGKGEALWKSLLVTSGSIVAFVDADLCEFDPGFVTGLVGPLLTAPSVQFVKAFYDRPLQTADTLLPAGGGRVTELLARPLLNLHWPDLAGVVQPLAGEYAGRRALLEQLPFMSGYGVEIAMLIDVLERVGLAGMAQVDLGCRRHRNSPDAALGRMAAQVYLAFLSRMERYGRGLLAADPATSLTQFLRRDGDVVAGTSDVRVRERPPVATLDGYRSATTTRSRV